MHVFDLLLTKRSVYLAFDETRTLPNNFRWTYCCYCLNAAVQNSWFSLWRITHDFHRVIQQEPFSMSPKPSQRDVKSMFLSCSKRNNKALTIQTKYRALEMQAFPLLGSPDSGKHAKFLRKRRNPASHVKYKTEIAIWKLDCFQLLPIPALQKHLLTLTSNGTWTELLNSFKTSA